MSIIVKRGASTVGWRCEILQASIDCERIFARKGVDLVVTSGAEQYKHSAERSAHYRGDAQDWRIKHIPDDQRAAVTTAVKRKLGKDFVVIHEGKGKAWEHLHVHWSPIYNQGA